MSTPSGSRFADRIWTFRSDPDMTTRSGFFRPDPDSPIGSTVYSLTKSWLAARIRIRRLNSLTGSGFADWIRIHRLDPDLSTRSGFLNRIRIQGPDPDSPNRSGFVDRILIIFWLYPDLPTGSGFADLIRICRPDPDLPTGSGFANRIAEICWLDPDSLTGFVNRIQIFRPDWPIGSRFVNQIWIFWPDPDSPTEFGFTWPNLLTGPDFVDQTVTSYDLVSEWVRD
jgi:hypothetical protein